MTCEELRGHMVALIYNEIADEEREEVEKHLRHCPQCANEVGALERTSKLLEQWKDAETCPEFVFVPAERGRWEGLRRLFRVPMPVYVAAGAFVCALVVLAAANTHVKYVDGDFSMRMSLIPVRDDASEVLDDVSEVRELAAELVGIQQETLFVLTQVISTSQERQKEELARYLSEWADRLDYQRRHDVTLVGQTLDAVEMRTTRDLQRTNDLLEGLLAVSALQTEYLTAPRGEER